VGAAHREGAEVALASAIVSVLLGASRVAPVLTLPLGAALLMFFRTIGGAMSVGALGAVLVASVGEHVPAALLNQLLGPDHGRGLEASVLAQLSGDLRTGVRHVFEVIAATAVGALAVGLLFPKRQLSQVDAAPVSQPAGE
jgi:hypothetical protein